MEEQNNSVCSCHRACSDTKTFQVHVKPDTRSSVINVCSVWDFQDVQQPGNQTNLRSHVSFVLVDCVWPVFYSDTILPIKIKCVNPSASRLQHLVLLYASAQLYKSKVKTNVWYLSKMLAIKCKQKSFQAPQNWFSKSLKDYWKDQWLYSKRYSHSFGVVTKVVESSV